MDFKHEYQSEMQRLSPTEEQIERIKNGVKKQLDEPQPKTKKKPMYLKIAAISGSSVCAAAVLMFVFIGIAGNRIPGMSDMLAPTENNTANGLVGGVMNEGAAPPLYYEDTGSAGGCTEDNAYNGIDYSKVHSETNSSKSQSISSSESSISAMPGSTGLGESSADQNSSIPFLVFSEDGNQCTVIFKGDQLDYTADTIGFSDEEIKDFHTGESILPAYTKLVDQEDVKIKLFVKFDENHMSVFTEDGKLLNQYTLI